MIRKRVLKFIELSGYEAAWLACQIHNIKSRQSEVAVPINNDKKPSITQNTF